VKLVFIIKDLISPSLILSLWTSGQSSWLQIQRSGSDCRRYLIFSEVVGLERGPLNLANTTEELLGRNKATSVKKGKHTAIGFRDGK
jgi:hypothetical protein